jgi:hypothetical protein
VMPKPTSSMRAQGRTAKPKIISVGAQSNSLASTTPQSNESLFELVLPPAPLAEIAGPAPESEYPTSATSSEAHSSRRTAALRDFRKSRQREDLSVEDAHWAASSSAARLFQP